MRAAVPALVLAGCAHAAPPSKAPADPFATDPVAVMATLEDLLSNASQVDVTMKVHTLGAMALELAGEVHVEPQRVSWIKLRGTQQGGPVTAKWSSITPFDPTMKDTQSPTWADALMISLLRMGATHDWALVSGGEDPETGHGDIRSWVTTSDPHWKHDDPGTHTLTFSIEVLGTTTGEAELTLDDRGLPLRRDQVVHFEDAELRVVEDYTKFDVR